MLEIHYCGEDSRPLCGRAAGEGWLWTITPSAVTCAGCGSVLARQRQGDLEPTPLKAGNVTKTA